MKISVEISMYPFTTDYIPPIKSFIEQLNTDKEIVVKTNTMSTQIFGEYNKVMSLLQNKVFQAFQSNPKVVMVMKIINADLEK